MILEERDLRFDFSDIVDPIKFDQPCRTLPNYHDKPNMPRVDFVIEDDDIIYFIEVKDPADPRSNEQNLRSFLESVINGELIETLFKKYWNSFVFRWAENCLSKHVAYLCVITLEESMTVQLTEELNTKLYNLRNMSSRWRKNPLINCQVLSFDGWNSNHPQWPAVRISEE